MSSGEKKYGNLTDIELGLIIAAVGITVLATIILSNLCYYKCRRKQKKVQQPASPRGIVGTEIQRTVNGQNMEQVIINRPPSEVKVIGDQVDMPYKTMDAETHAVRYDTDDVVITFHDTNGREVQVITKAENEDIDSGTGESPNRMSANENEGNDYLGHEDDFQQQSYDMPPPPQSQPPPLTPGTPPMTPGTPPMTPGTPPMTPGTPVTDLDADNSIPVPPPLPTVSSLELSPTADDYVYAQITKRPSESQEVNNADSSSSISNKDKDEDIDDYKGVVPSSYRSPDDIDIVEKARF